MSKQTNIGLETGNAPNFVLNGLRLRNGQPDWHKIEALDWVAPMKNCPQDHIYHAEGDVWTHTRMVVDELLQDLDYQDLEPFAQEVLFISALLHDIAKPVCTFEENGRITSPKHAAVGEKMVRELLWNADLEIRETVAALVRFHGLPIWSLDKYNPHRAVITSSLRLPNPQRLYYDNRDLLTLTQDGNMRVADPTKYLATHFDDYGRVSTIGFINTNNPVQRATEWLYGDLNSGNNKLVDNNFYQEQTHLKNMPANSYVWALGTLKSTDKTVMYRGKVYNAKGEFSWTCPEYLNMQNCSDATYNSAGKPINTGSYNNFNTYTSSGAVAGLYQMFYSNHFDYDQNLRQTINSQYLWGPNGGQAYDGSWHNLSEVKYTHLDQVKEKNIGSDRWNNNRYLQSIDYTYNNRGWLTAINQTGLSTGIPINGGNIDPGNWVVQANDYGKVDVFGEIIKFSNPTAYSGVTTPTPQAIPTTPPEKFSRARRWSLSPGFARSLTRSASPTKFTNTFFIHAKALKSSISPWRKSRGCASAR